MCDTTTHPSGSCVFVRFHLARVEDHGDEAHLRVQIAGLVTGAQYTALVQLTRGREAPCFQQSRSVALGSDQVALLQFAVNLPADDAHELVFEVYEDLDSASSISGTCRTLLAVAERSVVISKETGQSTFSTMAIEVVGQKRARANEEIETPKTAKKPTNRQADVLRCIEGTPVTEREILGCCGDNRYTREILRRLLALESVERMGKGGASDPYHYRFLCTPEEALENGKVDPAVSIRMQRIEKKILALLSQHQQFVNEKKIRATVGDNTGTGKALRNLVKTLRVMRIGKGGVGDPFTYKAAPDDTSIANRDRPTTTPSTVDSHEISDCSTAVSSKSSVVDADEVHTDEETEVAHTLALLASCSSSRQLLRTGTAAEQGNVASIYDMYIAAAAALDAAAVTNSLTHQL